MKTGNMLEPACSYYCSERNVAGKTKPRNYNTETDLRGKKDKIYILFRQEFLKDDRDAPSLVKPFDQKSRRPTGQKYLKRTARHKDS